MTISIQLRDAILEAQYTTALDSKTIGQLAGVSTETVNRVIRDSKLYRGVDFPQLATL